MATVLIVEDEDTLRDSVARYLEFEGHDVLAAANGREAFDLGVSGRPDVLVADWMLRNHIHGLHVAQTLRVVDPGLNTVLITGFPSRDLEQEFESGGVTQMLEKPFDLEDLNRAILVAAEQRSEREAHAAAVLEVARAGAISFANRGARALLAQCAAGEH
ncbi:MAG: response regulator, partial [Myxococcales bacterium]|nr:response regulator [Myxococcales bacterium]